MEYVPSGTPGPGDVGSIHCILVSPNPWQMKFAQCAASPSPLPRMRFSDCALGPSSLLWRVHIVCSSPSSLTEPERGSLPSVQPSPSSLMRDEVYPVCNHPSSLLRDEVYPVCNQPLIPVRWSLQVCNQPLIHPKDEVYLLCSGPLIPSER